MTNARFSILQARAVSDPNITNSQFRTLAALGIYGDTDGWCWPKLATLGAQLNKSKQAVSRDLQHLAACGYIEIHEQRRDDGGRTNNRYRLLFDSTPHQHHVDTPSTSEVDAPSTSEVDALTTHINDLFENIEEEGEAPEFLDMRNMLSRMTGLLPSPGDIPAIEECAAIGVTEDDIAGALQWRKDNGRAGAKTIAQLLPGIKTNYSIRIQNKNARKPKDNHRPGKTPTYDKAIKEFLNGN